MAGKSEKEDYEDRLADRLADLLVAAFKRKQAEGPTEPQWLTAAEAAARAQVAKRTIYNAVNSKRLRAARVGDKRALRFRAEWIDQWLESCAPREIKR